ncbi:TipAS antibiotic-recognition domain-containing protein [Nonomuraea dietziae]|uniref:TipAS antibiotic-recognition domain-containing protein n=1 Tax=Nonomuraea dietziae TaxID=65515 RepID=UPI00360A1A53
MDNPYAEEAAERWGGTDAWAESQRRTSSYREEDWRRCTAESGEISAGLAALMASGGRFQPRGHGSGRGAPPAHHALVLRVRFGDPQGTR